MALFGKKKEETKKDNAPKSVETEAVETKTEPAKKETSKKAPQTPKLTPGRNLSSVIVKPRITEKAALLIDRNVYTFVVRPDATKRSVKDAIEEIYSVTPIKVNIVNKEPRHYTSRMRGRDMMEKGMKKAYIYLKEGDRIDLM